MYYELASLGVPPRVLVVGAGALGSGLGQVLQEANLRFALLGRNGFVMKPYSVMVGGDSVLVTPETNELQKDGFQIVFFATKAYDLDGAINQVAPELAEGAVAISLANGFVLPVVEAAQKRYPHVHWRPGFTTIAVSRVEDQWVRKDSRGELRFGPLESVDACTKAEQILLKNLLHVAFRDERVLHGVASKWLFNVVINTMCAAYSLPYNGLLMDRLPEVQAVFGEAHQLALTVWGENAPRESGDELFARLLSLIQKTAGNENSMATDRRLGRRLEHSYLAGLANDDRAYPHLTRLGRLIAVA